MSKKPTKLTAEQRREALRKMPMPDKPGAQMQVWIQRNARYSERVLPGGERIIRNDKPVPKKETK